MHRTLRPWFLFLVLALLFSPACAKQRYHWESVPYCAGSDGVGGGHFARPLRLLTRHGDGGGVSTLHGMRPSRSVEFSSELLFALVACESADLLPEARDLETLLSRFTESSVPAICAGQRVVVPPTRVRATKTSRQGFQGALRFPEVPVAELKCTGGSVALGSGAP